MMAEVLAEQALARPQIIPLVPLTNQYRHQDHTDHKDYKSKVRLAFLLGSLTPAWFSWKMSGCVLCGLQSLFLSFSLTRWKFLDRRESMRRSRRYCLSHRVPPTIKGPPSSMPRTLTSTTSPALMMSPFPRYLQLTQSQRLSLSGGSWLS